MATIDINQVKHINEHTDTVWQIKYSPNGGMLASASNDTTVKIWDAGVVLAVLS